MSEGRIRLLELERFIWVLEDAEGVPMCIGDPRNSREEALASITCARDCAEHDARYERRRSGFALRDASGTVLGRRDALAGPRARELAIAWIKRELVRADMDHEDR